MRAAAFSELLGTSVLSARSCCGGEGGEGRGEEEEERETMISSQQDEQDVSISQRNTTF